MFRCAIYTLAGGFLATCLMFTAPSSARAQEDAYDVQTNTRNVNWNRYGRWRNRNYSPYYRYRYNYGYRPQYGRYYNYRPYYGYRNYGYRDYGYGNRYYRRGGGAVRVGPLRFYWR